MLRLAFLFALFAFFALALAAPPFGKKECPCKCFLVKEQFHAADQCDKKHNRHCSLSVCHNKYGPGLHCCYPPSPSPTSSPSPTPSVSPSKSKTPSPSPSPTPFVVQCPCQCFTGKKKKKAKQQCKKLKFFCRLFSCQDKHFKLGTTCCKQPLPPNKPTPSSTPVPKPPCPCKCEKKKSAKKDCGVLSHCKFLACLQTDPNIKPQFRCCED